VKVPDIDRNDAHVPWVNLLAREYDFASGRITRLKGQFDLHGPSLSHRQENENSAEESVPVHGGVMNRNCQEFAA
jgi:hypothetical protein